MPHREKPTFRLRRPRHGAHRRNYRISIQVSEPEYELLMGEAVRQELALGAAIRDFALVTAASERMRRGDFLKQLDR
jgi:hypothetical protein